MRPSPNAVDQSEVILSDDGPRQWMGYLIPDGKQVDGTMLNLTNIQPPDLVIDAEVTGLIAGAQTDAAPPSHRTRTCLRCGHSWTPRKSKRPAACALCRSTYWDTAPRIGISEVVHARMAKRAAMRKKRQDWDARIKERRAHAAFTAHAKKLGPIARELVLALYPLDDADFQPDPFTAMQVDRIAKLIEEETQPERVRVIPVNPIEDLRAGIPIRTGIPVPPWMEGQ